MGAKQGRGPNRAFRWFERTVLSIGMTAVAFVVERRLLKAMRTGGVKPAPRTAAEGESLGEAYAVDPVTGHASPADESGEPPERP